MGTTARLLVLGGPDDLIGRARARLAELEARWSRFVPGSELCRVNDAAGSPVMVSHDTYYVVALAVGSWRATGGRFDPTILGALERAGYDRDFDAVRTRDEPAPDPAPPRRAPGCAGIELLPLVPAVQLPAGVRLDLGGIGKGRAADVLVEELLDAGATGVCVDLGGDVRVAGAAPERDGWRVVLDPDLAPGRAFRLSEGAVATSTRARRSWRRGGVSCHHLIDPVTGAPAATGLLSVTVVGREAAWSEVLAKAAFVAGPDAGRALLDEHGATGLLVHDDGRVEPLPGLEPYAS